MLDFDFIKKGLGPFFNCQYHDASICHKFAVNYLSKEVEPIQFFIVTKCI